MAGSEDPDLNALIAARNNADWCDAVCAANGVSAGFGAEMWASPTRTPLLYPDAVTLAPTTSARQVIDAIDASPGASVKDSFSSLDLAPHGFSVLFSAQWLSWHREVPARSGGFWQEVTSPLQLAGWVEVHGGNPPFPPTLLHDARVTILKGNVAGDTVGAALHAADGAVGVSNVFSTAGSVGTALWASLADECHRRYPSHLRVGYESGLDLAAAEAAGAEACGLLRVWVRDP